MNRSVFLDSSFWIALREPKEPENRRALGIFQTLIEERYYMVMTVIILAETHAYFSKSPDSARRILSDYEQNPILKSEPVTHQDEKAAAALLLQRHDKTYSFCDAVSFVIMRRLGIRRAASFDNHFRQFGEFEIVS